MNNAYENCMVRVWNLISAKNVKFYEIQKNKKVKKRIEFDCCVTCFVM